MIKKSGIAAFLFVVTHQLKNCNHQNLIPTNAVKSIVELTRRLFLLL